MFQPDLTEDVGELSDLREAQPRQHCACRRVAGRADDSRPDHELPHGHQKDHRGDGGNVFDQRHRPNQHPDRHEEDRNEHVADWQHSVEGAMRRLGFADHHAGQERSQCVGEPDDHGEGSSRHPDRHGSEEQKLVVAAARHQDENAGNDMPRQPDDGDQHEGGDQEPSSQRPCISTAGGAERGDEHRHHDHGEILDQRDPDDGLAMRRSEIAALQQEFHQHHRAGDAQRRTHDCTLRNSPAEEPAHADGEQRDQGDAERTADKGQEADPQQGLQRKLYADGEHQQNDADLCELLERVRVGYGQTRRERADDDAGDDIADYERLTQKLREYRSAKCGDEEQAEVDEELGFAHDEPPDARYL